jgi:DNA-binding transcriptional LysR family regulator
LRHYARRILKLHDEAMAAVARPEVSGRVRLGAPDDFSDHLLPEVLCRFAEAYPQVQVDVSCDPSPRLVAALDRGELDLAVCINSEVPQRGVTIHHEPVVWITSDRHLTHEQDPVPIAVYNETCIYRQWAIKSLDGQDRNYRIAFTSPSTSGILAAVKGGLAIAPVGRTTLPRGVRILGPADGFPELPSAVVTLIKAQGPRSKAVEFLAEHVIERFKELSITGNSDFLN